MKANERELMIYAVEIGVSAGVRRAYKHSDAEPPTDSQVSVITEYVMNSIYEWFIFDQNEERP